LSAGKKNRKNYYRNSAAGKSAQRRRRRLRFLKAVGFLSVVIAMSLAFILCHDLLMQCDYFNARRIIVTGESRLTSDEIVRQADIASGINILSLNLVKARKRLLAHPWIEEADVSRKLPDEIRIHVREQRALAVVDLGRKFIMNTDGVIFKELGPADPGDLPVVCGLQFSDVGVDGTPRAPAFRAVMTVLTLGRAPGAVLSNRVIKRIDVDREIGVTLHAFGAEKLIKLGFEGYSDKYRTLKQVLYHLKEKSTLPDFDSIDLMDLNRVVVNPTKDGATGAGRKEV